MLPHDRTERDPTPRGDRESEATSSSSGGASGASQAEAPSAVLEAAMQSGSAHLCALVEEIQRFGSMDELSRTLARIVLRLQFDTFLFLLARYPHRNGGGGDSLPLLLSNYPSRWAERYIGERRYLKDPALAKGELHRAPFPWIRGEEGTPAPASPAAPGHAGMEGAEHGLTVPIHGPRGELAFFAVGSRRSEQPGDAGRSSEILLQLVAFHAYAALLDRVAKNAVGDSFGLTEHERQCLHWTARGKTTWETATILKRSTATINFHLRKACRKLGAANKCEAAARAAYHGVLTL
jgi:LuxR family transcriptional activator of conjugal transfer of Ti plasmids